MVNVKVYKEKSAEKKKFYNVDIENFKKKGNYFNAYRLPSLEFAVKSLIGHMNHYKQTIPNLEDYFVSYEKPSDCSFNGEGNCITNIKDLNFFEKKAFEFYLKKHLRKNKKQD
jgi:hypothetical protein